MSSLIPLDAPVKRRGAFHNLFDLVILLKGLNGVAEISVGATLLAVKAGSIMEWVQWLTQSGLLHDHGDLLATSLKNWALNFVYDAQIFAGVYLLVHGAIKSTLAVLLYKERPWVFPLALVLFSVLVAVAVHHLIGHWSWPLMGFIVFDIFTIVIIAQEWKALRKIGLAKKLELGGSGS